MIMAITFGASTHATPCPTVNPVTGTMTPSPGMMFDWVGCNLRGANFSGLTIYGCSIDQSNLSHANFTNASIQNCYISDSNLQYANFTNANLADTGFFKWAFLGQYAGSDLSYAILTNAYVENTDFSLTTLDGVTSGGLIGVPWDIPSRYALINGYILGVYANLTGADLSNQDLSGFGLLGANLTNANLTNSNLQNTFLYSANLTNTNMTNVTFTQGKLNYATLNGTILTGANLSGTNISNATLSGVNFTNTNLTSANLTAASLTNIIWNNTTCIDSTDSDLHLDGSCLNPMDHDRDGLANATDLDDDGDGTPDYIDIAPLDAGNNSEIPLQTDGNYKGTTVRDVQAVE